MTEAGIPEWLVLEAKPRRVPIPYEARYPDRLARTLKPVRVLSPVKGFAWYLCSLSCALCVVAGDTYTVSMEKRVVKDVLSDLRHEVVSRLIGLVDGRPVWSASWSGDKLRVGEVKCDALVYPGGFVRCTRGLECTGPQCLVDCLYTTRG